MSRSALAWILALPAALAAQGPGPRQDEAAVALLRRAASLEYSARREGLKSASYRHELSQFPGIRLAIRWAEGGPVSASLAGAEDLDEQVRGRLGEVLIPAARQVADLVLGKDALRGWAKDDILLEGERAVRVRHRSASGEVSGEETLVSFGQDGLPARTDVRGKGPPVTMAMEYERRGGRHFLKKATSTQGERRVELSFAWHEVDGFHFPSVVEANTPEGLSRQTFSDFAVAGTPGSRKKDGEGEGRAP